MRNQRCIAKIVPAVVDGNGIHPTQGTQVIVGGVSLEGVYRITLVADVNDLWRAVIECHAEVPEILADAIVIANKESWIRKAWRMIRKKAKEVTTLMFESKEWIR